MTFVHGSMVSIIFDCDVVGTEGISEKAPDSFIYAFGKLDIAVTRDFHSSKSGWVVFGEEGG